MEIIEQQTQAKFSNWNTERKYLAIMVDKNQIEKLSDVITKEITKINGTDAETRDRINSFIAKHNENIGKLNEKDNALQNKIEDLKSISQANSDRIQREVNGKLVVLKEEYIATTSSLRTETQTLTQSLQVSKSQQVSIERE